MFRLIEVAETASRGDECKRAGEVAAERNGGPTYSDGGEIVPDDFVNVKHQETEVSQPQENNTRQFGRVGRDHRTHSGAHGCWHQQMIDVASRGWLEKWILLRRWHFHRRCQI